MMLPYKLKTDAQGNIIGYVAPNNDNDNKCSNCGNEMNEFNPTFVNDSGKKFCSHSCLSNLSENK